MTEDDSQNWTNFRDVAVKTRIYSLHVIKNHPKDRSSRIQFLAIRCIIISHLRCCQYCMGITKSTKTNLHIHKLSMKQRNNPSPLHALLTPEQEPVAAVGPLQSQDART